MTDRKITILEKSRLFDGFFKLDGYRIRQEADGRVMEFPRINLERGHSAAILPYDAKTDRVLVIEEFRIGVMAAGFEGEACFNIGPIAGMLDGKDDAPEACAIREAKEEAGLDIEQDAIISSRTIFPSPGGSSEMSTLILARADLSGVTPGVYGLDGEAEQTWVKIMTRTELLEVVRTQPVSGHLSNLAMDLEVLALRAKMGDPEAAQALGQEDAPKRFYMFCQDAEAFMTRSGGHVSQDELAKMTMEERSGKDLITSTDSNAVRQDGLWIREDLVSSEPVIAELYSDDRRVERMIDVRPALMELEVQTTEDLEDTFPCDEFDEIYYCLERMGDPSALALSDYLGLRPTMGFTNETVRFEVSPLSGDVRDWFPETESNPEPA